MVRCPSETLHITMFLNRFKIPEGVFLKASADSRRPVWNGWPRDLNFLAFVGFPETLLGLISTLKALSGNKSYTRMKTRHVTNRMHYII